MAIQLQFYNMYLKFREDKSSPDNSISTAVEKMNWAFMNMYKLIKFELDNLKKSVDAREYKLCTFPIIIIFYISS